MIQYNAMRAPRFRKRRQAAAFQSLAEIFAKFSQPVRIRDQKPKCEYKLAVLGFGYNMMQPFD